MNSIQRTFPDAHLLKRMFHLTDNCKLKAKESQLPEAIVSEVIRQLMLSTPFSFKEDAEKTVAALQKTGLISCHFCFAVHTPQQATNLINNMVNRLRSGEPPNP